MSSMINAFQEDKLLIPLTQRPKHVEWKDARDQQLPTQDMKADASIAKSSKWQKSLDTIQMTMNILNEKEREIKWKRQRIRKIHHEKLPDHI